MKKGKRKNPPLIVEWLSLITGCIYSISVHNREIFVFACDCDCADKIF